MSIALGRNRFGPDDRRRLAIVAGSLAFHALILGPLALRLFEPSAPSLPAVPPLVFLDIEPRPLLAGETARTPAPSAASAPRDSPVPGQVASGTPSLERLRDEDEEDAPPGPSPRLASPAPAGTPQPPAGPWSVTPEGMAAAVARSMRTGAGGCRIMDGRLTPGEQALCDERFNEAAGRAGPLGPRTLNASEARREAQFAADGARALAQYEARRRPLAGGVGIVGPGDCPGSNLGVGCAGAHLDPAIRQGGRTVGNPGMGSNDPDAMRPIPGNE